MPVPRPGLATWRQPGGSGRGRRDLLADRTKADWRFGPRTNQRVRHLVGGSARHLARRPTWSRRFPCVPKNLRPSTVAGTPSREAGCAPNPTSSRVDRRRWPPGLPPSWMPRLNRTRRMPRGCRIVPAPLRAEPSPGMSDRPRMPTTGSRPAGGPGPAARDGPPRSSGGEGLDSSRVNPDRPRTPRTGRRSPHRRWEAQAQSSPPIIPADLNALTATLRVPLPGHLPAHGRARHAPEYLHAVGARPRTDRTKLRGVTGPPGGTHRILRAAGIGTIDLSPGNQWPGAKSAGMP